MFNPLSERGLSYGNFRQIAFMKLQKRRFDKQTKSLPHKQLNLRVVSAKQNHFSSKEFVMSNYLENCHV